MVLKVSISLIFCVFGLLFGSTQVTKADVEFDKIIKRYMEIFGHRLLTKFAAENPKQNIVFSPFSIETCLTMVRMGAADETAYEIDEAFDLSANDAEDLQNYFHSILKTYQNNSYLQMANKIYAMAGYELQDEYNELLTQRFFSSVEPLDFGESETAAEAINTWVESETNKTIKNLVNPDLLDTSTRLVLVNAIYFKGNWVHQFNEESTKEWDFYLDDTRTVKVQMMHSKAYYKYADLKSLDAAVVELPYKNSDLSMVIVLPNSRTGLEKLKTQLSWISISFITERMRTRETIVKLPKFKAEFQIELSETLKNMDMKVMFSKEADFSKMLKSNESLYISSALHKAFIEVNERGTEAAAATYFGAVALSAVDDTKVFIADHGFLYFIRSRNGIVLFEGEQTSF